MSPEGLPLPVGCDCGCPSSIVAVMMLLLCAEACYTPHAADIVSAYLFSGQAADG